MPWGGTTAVVSVMTCLVLVVLGSVVIRVMGRWLALFVMARLGATALAVLLLLVHTVTSHDLALVWIGGAYGAASAAAAAAWPRLQEARWAWALDVAIALALVAASAEWRSPFYLMAVTSLIFPATALRLHAAFALGAGFTVMYLGVAIFVGVDVGELRSTTRLESFATHLITPMLVAVALAYAAALLEERERAARLSMEAERRRIAWDLHDSAKQRVHAAHLVLSAFRRRIGEEPAVDQAIGELRAATVDMEMSLLELRMPLEGGGLQAAVRSRAEELAAAAGVPIEVRGDAPDLPGSVAAHVFRVAGEAMTNAVRHARAERVIVELAGDDRELRVVVADDGHGIARPPRPGSHGLRSMAARADTLGGSLEIGAGDDGQGTVVRLRVPLEGGREPE